MVEAIAVAAAEVEMAEYWPFVRESLSILLCVCMVIFVVVPEMVQKFRHKKNVQRVLDELETGAQRRGWNFARTNSEKQELRGTDEDVAWKMDLTRSEDGYELRWTAALDVIPDEANWRALLPIEFGPLRSFPEHSLFGRLALNYFVKREMRDNAELKNDPEALEALKIYQQMRVVPLSHPKLRSLFGVKCSAEQRAQVQVLFNESFENWLISWLENWPNQNEKNRDQNLKMNFFQSDLTVTARTNSLPFAAVEQLIDSSVSLVSKYRRTS